MFVKMAGLPYVKRVLQAKVSTPFLKIVECSSFQYGTGAGGFPADRRRGRDFIYTKISVRPRSGFYLHKESRAGEILDLIYATTFARPGSDVDL